MRMEVGFYKLNEKHEEHMHTNNSVFIGMMKSVYQSISVFQSNVFAVVGFPVSNLCPTEP